MAHSLSPTDAELRSLTQLRWSAGQLGLTLALLFLLGWALLTLAHGARLARAAQELWARPELLGVFLAAYTAAFALRAWAWQCLLPDRPGAPRLFVMLQVALLANHLFPGKAGEAVRVGLLARAGVPLGVAAGSTALARLLDFVTLGLVALALGPLAGGQLQSLLALLSLPLVAAGLGVAGYLLLVSGRLAGLWHRLPAPLGGLAQRVEMALAATPPRRLAAAAALAAPSWLLEGSAVWAVAQAAGVPLSPQAAAAATAIAIAFQAAPVTPGGLGVYEASLTAALALFGVSPTIGLGLAVATHALKFAYAYAAGIPCLAAEGLVWRHGDAGTCGRGAGNSRLWASPRRRALMEWFVALLWLTALAALLPAVLARLWWRARRPLPPPGPPPRGGTVAIVIPVYNEATSVGTVVAGVPRAALNALGFEARVIVVDDGSRDDSAAVARTAGADIIVRHAVRRGLGAALRSGLSAALASGAVAAVYLDGDGEYDPADVTAVVWPVLTGEADYVLGSRFPDAARVMRPSRRWGNVAFTWLLRLLTGRWLRDGQTGCRAFGARALQQAEIIHDYNYAQVLTLDLLQKRMRLAEVPVSYRLRQSGSSFIRSSEYLARVLPAIAREVLRG